MSAWCVLCIQHRFPSPDRGFLVGVSDPFMQAAPDWSRLVMVMVILCRIVRCQSDVSCVCNTGFPVLTVIYLLWWVTHYAGCARLVSLYIGDGDGDFATKYQMSVWCVLSVYPDRDFCVDVGDALCRRCLIGLAM